MKIKTVCDLTGLTDRTIRYYIEEHLISPAYTENYLGRKSFSFTQEDIDALKSISVLRKFDFSIEEIREILNDAEKSKTIIQNVKSRNKQSIAAEQLRQSILSQIEDNKAYTVAKLAKELYAASERIPKAEETPKHAIRKRILTALRQIFTFLTVWLPVAFQFLFFTETLIIYAYPKFYPSATAYMLLSILPSILVLCLNKITKTWKRIAKAVLLALCTASLLCSLVVSIFPAGLMAMSETTDIEEYCDLDADCPANRDFFFRELFPSMPHYFENVEQSSGHFETVYLDAHYYYRYLSIMDYTYDVYAQWPLEKENFDKEVSRVKALYENHAAEYNRSYVIAEHGSYTCLIAYTGNPPFQKVTDSYTYYIFAYDEENLVVRYILCDSLENGADQPYYLSLDW